MIVVMGPGACEEEILEVEKRIKRFGYDVHRSNGENRTILGTIGHPREDVREAVAVLPSVEKVVLVSHPFKLVSREYQNDSTVIKVGDVEIGGNKIVMIAGPSVFEDRDSYLAVAESVKKAGANILRGGIYKPRAFRESFQVMEEKCLQVMAAAREMTGLPVITEVLDQYSVEIVSRYVDIIQVGANNMQNFRLLRDLGQLKKPVLIKRGQSSTIEEWLMAAEYLLSSGNNQVILCERGIRTFEKYTRNTLDISAVPVVKELSHLPVFVDPSHGTGNGKLVPPMSLATVAAGADGLLVDVQSASKETADGQSQSMVPEKFAQMVISLRDMAQSTGRIL